MVFLAGVAGPISWCSVNVVRCPGCLHALIRTQRRAHDGYEVKTMGDGFMRAVRSARKGLDCAIAIQPAFAAQHAANGACIRVRIGLHAGEAIRDGADFYGTHVVYAVGWA